MKKQTKRIIEVIDEWNEAYNNHKEDSVTHWVQSVIKNYVKLEDKEPDYYELEMFKEDNELDKVVLKCRCGGVDCYLEISDGIAFAYFKNLINEKELDINSVDTEPSAKLDRKLFEIFD